MAKLEEQVAPAELLDMIRKGAMKSELGKKYRVSEQDLAMMLLPLYRTEEMTKEEFNDFFSEKPLRTKSATPQPKPEDEPPSEILASLSKLFGKKQEAEKPETPAAPVPAAAPPPPPPPPTPVASDEGPSAPLQLAVVPAAPAPTPAPQPPEPKAAPPKPSPPEAAPVEEVPKEPLNVSSALASILSKLNSIEKRLAKIEAKIMEQ